MVGLLYGLADSPANNLAVWISEGWSMSVFVGKLVGGFTLWLPMAPDTQPCKTS